ETYDCLGELLLDDRQEDTALGCLLAARKVHHQLLEQVAEGRRQELPPSALREQARNHISLAKFYRERDPGLARRHLDEAKDFLEVLKEVRGRPDQDEAYTRALYHAVSGDLNGAERGTQGGAATQHLSEAIEAGYRNRAQLNRDVGFGAWLRQREDFRQLR